MITIYEDSNYRVALFVAKRVSWEHDLRTNMVKVGDSWSVKVSNHSAKFHLMDWVRSYALGVGDAYRHLKGITK